MDYLNKLPKPEYGQTMEIMKYLENRQFKVFYETFGNGISDSLRKEILPGRYLAFGESGVGKSTFINQMAGHKPQIWRKLF
jgi:putative ribosome biogenesis GTPase RsgA